MLTSIYRIGTVIGILLCTLTVLADEKSENRLITVTGTAEVKVTPDVAELQLGVETREKDLSSAKAENDAAVNAVITSVKKFGIGDKDIQTTGLQIQPNYNDERDGRRLLFYSVDTEIGVATKDVKRVGELVAAMVQ